MQLASLRAQQTAPGKLRGAMGGSAAKGTSPRRSVEAKLSEELAESERVASAELYRSPSRCVLWKLERLEAGVEHRPSDSESSTRLFIRL